ncbi:hypothetical protein AGDE_02775 [Angomonas deanei]|nr:hypothetical protein AGDE_06503 [Angomonas deanei]EPY41150.1 hypothetical protein AGDE_02775 [Angomonas deanei]|eukprot:EPY37431.1 hypothetical protein AGDE_06503 [Angomonas deanei]
MFSRRVFASSPIPRAMYAKLGISTPTQASRLLPSFVALSPSLCNSVSPAGRVSALSAVESDLEADGARLSDIALMRAIMESFSGCQLGMARMLELWGIRRVLTLQGQLHTLCRTQEEAKPLNVE